MYTEGEDCELLKKLLGFELSKCQAKRLSVATTSLKMVYIHKRFIIIVTTGGNSA